MANTENFDLPIPDAAGSSQISEIERIAQAITLIDGLLHDGVQGRQSLRQHVEMLLDDFSRHKHNFAELEQKPTTLEGFGITDAKTATQITSEIEQKISVAVGGLIDGSPAALDTLRELAAALGNDPNFASSIATQIGQKLNASAYTAADVLAKLVSVDGHGSGLDADALDGLHASAFLTRADAYAMYARIGVAGVMTHRDFANGTLIVTSLDASQMSGAAFVFEITGNSYSQRVPFDIRIQGYIYNDTIINVGGVSNGTTISGMVLCNFDGKLSLWFPRQAYWHGYTVKVYDCTLHDAPVNAYLTYYDTSFPSGVTKVVPVQPAVSWTSENFDPAAINTAVAQGLSRKVTLNGPDNFSLHANFSGEGLYFYNGTTGYYVCSLYNWQTFAGIMAESGAVHNRIESRADALASYYANTVGNARISDSRMSGHVIRSFDMSRQQVSELNNSGYVITSVQFAVAPTSSTWTFASRQPQLYTPSRGWFAAFPF